MPLSVLLRKDNTMTETQQYLYDQVLKDHEYVVSLRRWFHQHPELAKEEFETQKTIEQELDKLGIAHRRVAGTPAWHTPPR